MATLIRIDNNRSGYRDLVTFVMERGIPQSSRNGDTLEVNDMVVELANPTKSIPSGIGRRGYSYSLAALEGLQLIAGITWDGAMVQVAPNTEQFREDDGQFHGGYGRRIGSQLPIIVERLKADPDTRQAVVTLWDPELDAKGGKKDHPCTCLFNWRIRNGQLLMSTFMRSQDVHWGWPYDVVMFTTLQLAMAKYLGVEAGPYTHHAASFHIYTRDLPALRSLTPFNGEEVNIGPIGTGEETHWQDVRDRAIALFCDSAAIKQPARTRDYVPTDDELWYRDAIAKKLQG